MNFDTFFKATISSYDIGVDRCQSLGDSKVELYATFQPHKQQQNKSIGEINFCVEATIGPKRTQAQMSNLPFYKALF